MRKLPAIVFGLVIAACGAVEEGSGTTPTSATTADRVTSTTVQIPSNTEGTVPADLDQVSAAIADLAQHLQVEPGSIEFVEVRVVQWPDGSLDCPQEGEIYTQAVVDGSQVILRVDGRVYDYRADDIGNVKLCSSEDKDGGYDFVPPPGFDEN
jgi:hypothetical protein